GSAVACYLLVLFFENALQLASTASYALGGAILLVVAIITRGSLGAWLLFVLIIAHVLVGAVELGTDGWIQNITGNILTTSEGKILFVYTSAFMFCLRFCADFIEKKIGLSPVGILLACALIACVGLNLVSGIATFAGAIFALS